MAMPCRRPPRRPCCCPYQRHCFHYCCLETGGSPRLLPILVSCCCPPCWRSSCAASPQKDSLLHWGTAGGHTARQRSQKCNPPGTNRRAVFGPRHNWTGRGGASHLLTAASTVVAPSSPPNVPPNHPNPGIGNVVAYDSWLDHATARILLLDDDMGGNDKDCDDKDCNDKDNNNDGPGGGRQWHQWWRPPPDNDILIS
jgi:hypothetical protein